MDGMTEWKEAYLFDLKRDLNSRHMFLEICLEGRHVYQLANFGHRGSCVDRYGVIVQSDLVDTGDRIIIRQIVVVVA
jgi:hypothetical protein